MKLDLTELENKRIERSLRKIGEHLEKQKASTIEMVKMRRADKEAFRIEFEKIDLPEELKKLAMEDIEEAERWI